VSGRWLGREGKGGEGKEDEGGQRRTKEDKGGRRSTKEYKGVQRSTNDSCFREFTGNLPGKFIGKRGKKEKEHGKKL